MEWDVVFAYARVSSDEQAAGQAFEQQKERLSRAFPPASRLFEDIQTGNDQDRPAYQELRRLAREAAIQGLKVLIQVAKLDRLSRDDHEIEQAIAEFDRLGITLFALDGGIYSCKEAQEWLRTKQEGVFAQYFLRQLSSNIRRGKDYKRRMGRPTGNAPFGYKYNDDKSQFIPDPNRWEFARSMVVAYLPEPQGKGLPLSALRDMAAAEGWDTSPTSIRYWLCNPILRGHLTSRPGGWTQQEKKANIYKDLKISTWSAHTPLMSEAEWRTIERQLVINRRNWGNRKKWQSVNPLAGMCICDRCNHKMRYNRRVVNNKEYVYVKCQYKGCVNRFMCPEEVVHDAVQKCLSEAAVELAKLVANPPEFKESPEVLKLRSELAEVRKIQSTSSRPSAFNETIAELEASIDANQAKQETPELDLIELTRDFIDPSNWKGLHPIELRHVYGDLVKSVRVDGRNVVRVETVFPPQIFS